MIKILKVFYGFLTKKRFSFILFLVTVVVASVAQAITPYFYKLFVDAIPKLDYLLLLKILLLYIGVRLIALILNALSYFLGDVNLFDAAVDARTTVFKHIQDLDFAFHSSKSTGSLISAIKRGDGAFFTLYHVIHHRILKIVISFLVMLYFFSVLDIKITILVAVSFLFNLIIAKFVVSYNIKTRKGFIREEDKISAIVVDNMINYDTVKLFSKEDWEISRLNKAFVNWKKHLWRYANSFRTFDISIGLLVNLSIFLTLLLALKQTVDLEMTIGEFVLVVGFVSAFYPRLFDLVFSFRDIAKNYADIEKYFGILDYGIQIKDPQKPVDVPGISGEIEFKNVSFSYGERKEDAVSGIDLKVRQGQSVALVGRSGSGKTTLIRLLMRFYDVDKGKITIDNIDIKDFTKANLRSFIGIVPQEPILFNNTIGYNIGYGKKDATKKEIKAAAKMANIDKFIESLPKKYNTRVGERGIKLSGGQKQRLAIARMILSNPEIIIFDEATSQLDSESERLIQEAFWKVAKNKTTIIIAHRLSTAMRADKIVVLEEGKIIESGSHKALLEEKDSLYGYFWDLQINID